MSGINNRIQFQRNILIGIKKSFSNIAPGGYPYYTALFINNRETGHIRIYYLVKLVIRKAGKYFPGHQGFNSGIQTHVVINRPINMTFGEKADQSAVLVYYRSTIELILNKDV